MLWPLAARWWLGACCALLCPRGARADGLLAEYFAPLAATCSSVNGSLGTLAGLLPTITRRDLVVNFPERLSFGLKRCAWEVIAGATVYNCRGSEEMQKYFAARYTSSIVVYRPGLYTFEIEADDGARLTIGYGICPSVQCGDKTTVLNTQFSELRKTAVGQHTFAKECGQCEQGVYMDCWNTPEGCEPFSVWRLEADGAAGGGCGSPSVTVSGTRYLSGGVHPLELEYFQRGGGARLILRYSGPDTGGSMIPVPEEKLLFPRGNALRAEWYTLPSQPPLISSLPGAHLMGQPPPGAQLYLREDDEFDTNGPGRGAFSTRVTQLNQPIMVRWSGFFNLIEGGIYVFRLESDDGSRIVIAARGPGGERVLVSNDGKHAQAASTIVTVDMLPGLHPIRVEYFWVPGVDFGPEAVPTPPGIQLFYNGPDTRLQERRVTKDRLFLSDAGCQLNNFDWSLGMYMSRDCQGVCFDQDERIVGDKICDDGRNTFLGKRKTVTCPAYNMDNNDCEPIIKPPNAQVRPMYHCHVSCPSGNFRRRDCAQCARQVRSRNGTFCSQSDNGTLSYTRCCTAKLYGTEYWGQDCIAFGSTTTCSETFVEVLDALRENEPALDWQSARPAGARPYPTGDLMVDCVGDYCNGITGDFVLNQWTREPTDQRICPIQESKQNGTACFEGPWDVTYLKDPFTECQEGRYKWNFCRNRKTVDGRPFAKCCSFLYINAQGAGECRFVGIAEGTCDGYIGLLREQFSRSSYLSIANPMVLNECSGDMCNDPSDATMGCPEKVNYDHPYTLRDRLNQPTNWDAVPGPQSHPAEINWPAIFIPVGGVLVLCVAALAYRKASKEPEESPFHTSAAKVVGKDTFVEPTREPGVDGPTFGVVKPRPFALRHIIESERPKPAALKLDLSLANQEAAQQVQAEYDAKEEAIMGVPPPSPNKKGTKAASKVASKYGSKATVASFASSPLRRAALPPPGEEVAEIELPGAEEEVRALALHGEMLHQLAIYNDAAAAQAPADTTALVLKATPVELQEKLTQVQAPAEILLPVATLAASQAQTAAPDATPPIGPVSGGTRGRPAAAARFQRQGAGGMPRVAT